MFISSLYLGMTFLLVFGNAQDIYSSEINSIESLRDESIFCVRPNRFDEDLLLLCTRRGLLSFDPISELYDVLAGYVQFTDRSPRVKFLNGLNEEAKFDWIYDVQQYDRDTFIVSDFLNNCLRNISFEHTSGYAGACGLNGYLRDGSLSSAVFNGPSGLLLLPIIGQLYIADQNNNAIRLIDTNNKLVQTVIQASYSGMNSPSYITCAQDMCRRLFYVTVEHGVVSVNPSTRRIEYLAGGSDTGQNVGPFTETTFQFPSGMVSLDTGELLVVNRSPSRRIYKLNVTSQRSRYFVDASLVGDPWSIGLQDKFLFIGGSQQGGLHKVQIFDDCQDYEPCSTENEEPDQTYSRSTVTFSTIDSLWEKTTDIYLNHFKENEAYIIAGSVVGCTVILVIAIIVGVVLIRRSKQHHTLPSAPENQYHDGENKEKPKSSSEVDYEMYATVGNEYQPEPRNLTFNPETNATDRDYSGPDYSYTTVPQDRPLPVPPSDSDALISGKSLTKTTSRDYMEFQEEEPEYVDKDRGQRISENDYHGA